MINIAKEFTDAPGARYISDGPFSGEEFLKKMLKPRFLKAIEKECKLEVDVSDSWGYASSFLSGSFGALSTEFGRDNVLRVLEIVSDSTILKEKILEEIRNPKKKK